MFRLPTLNDVSKLISLINQLGYNISDDLLRQNLKSYGDSVFVMEIANEIVGFLAYHICVQFHSYEKHMRIVTVVVDQKERGKGVGKKLLQEAEKIADEQNCAIIELTSAAHRMNSHQFYLSLGYQMNGEKIYFRKEPRRKE